MRCELCPYRHGALKRTDSNSWAHVVCALYIPEVRFGNVATMEPIVLGLVPADRYLRVCYLCDQQVLLMPLMSLPFWLSLFFLGTRESGRLWGLHAVQPVWLQANVSCDLRTEGRILMRGGWKLHGQCQVLRLL